MFERVTLPNNVLPPVAPYCHAIRAGDFLFVTGQISEDPTTGAVIKSPIEDQTKQVMDNLKLVLNHMQAEFEKVVMARVFISDFRYYEAVNKVYATYFETGLPCRTAIGVTGLAGFADVEIDLIVYCGK